MSYENLDLIIDQFERTSSIIVQNHKLDRTIAENAKEFIYFVFKLPLEIRINVPGLNDKLTKMYELNYLEIKASDISPNDPITSKIYSDLLKKYKKNSININD